MKEIDDAKTLKAKEALIRELSEVIVQYGAICENNINAVELTYKCLSKVFAAYTGSKPLPAFIFQTIKDTQKKLLHYYCTSSPLPAFTTISDTFQYLDTIEFHRYNSLLEPFAEIVGSNIPSFSIRHHIDVPQLYHDLISSQIPKKRPILYMYESSIFPGTLYIEHVKSTLPKDKKYTVIEDILKKSYEAIGITQNNVTAIIKDAQEISDNLVKVTATMANKINQTNC